MSAPNGNPMSAATINNLEQDLVPVAGSAVSAAVSGVTAAPAITTTAVYVKVSILSNDVMYTDDGSTPAADAGYMLSAGSTALMRRELYAATKWFPLSGSPKLFATGYTRA